MATATKTQLRKLLGTEETDGGANYPTPPSCEGTKFVVRSSYYGATAPTDDLHEALDLGWEGYKMGEGLAEVWDYRSEETGEADPTHEPVLLAVVGVIWGPDA